MPRPGSRSVPSVASRGHADDARCSCAPCATTRPTPRSTATGCSSGPGYIRRISAGIYSWLPLGYRVLRKVEQIVREEMDAAGAQEVLLPIAQPLELWERSGRDTAYGPLMFRLLDRKETGVLPVADGRGGGDEHRRPGVRLVPRPAAQPVPDQLEVPRRAAAAVRAAARPRVPDEGRVLVRPRSRRAPRELPADVRRVPPRVRALRAHVPRGRGRVGRDGRLREPRVHGGRRRRRGRLRLVPELRLRGERRSGAARRSRRPRRGAGATARDGRGAHARTCRASPASPSSWSVEPAHAVEVDRVRRRRQARARASCPATAR